MGESVRNRMSHTILPISTSLVIGSNAMRQFILKSQGLYPTMTGEFMEHYHYERPHQGKGNVPLTGALRVASAEGEVVCRERLSGVLRHYYRLAA
jgi:hypothetical protein